MTRVFLFVGSIAVAIAVPSPAFAYTLKNATANGCGGDGTECVVFCNEGVRAGSMYWNGTVWTDGVKWDADRDREAGKIVAANGGFCAAAPAATQGVSSLAGEWQVKTWVENSIDHHGTLTISGDPGAYSGSFDIQYVRTDGTSKEVIEPFVISRIGQQYELRGHDVIVKSGSGGYDPDTLWCTLAGADLACRQSDVKSQGQMTLERS